MWDGCIFILGCCYFAAVFLWSEPWVSLLWWPLNQVKDIHGQYNFWDMPKDAYLNMVVTTILHNVPSSSSLSFSLFAYSSALMCLHLHHLLGKSYGCHLHLKFSRRHTKNIRGKGHQGPLLSWWQIVLCNSFSFCIDYLALIWFNHRDTFLILVIFHFSFIIGLWWAQKWREYGSLFTVLDRTVWNNCKFFANITLYPFAS